MSERNFINIGGSARGGARQLKASLAEFCQTFPNALGRSENALVAIESSRKWAGALSVASEHSEAALLQSKAPYREGLARLSMAWTPTPIAARYQGWPAPLSLARYIPRHPEQWEGASDAAG